MAENGENASILTFESPGSLGADECCLVPRNGSIPGTPEGSFDINACHMVPNRLLPGNRAYLDGNLVRRKLPVAASDYVIWDNELAGFGLRVRPSGKRYWFVRVRQRGKHRRASLGCTEDVDALTARGEARKLLAEVALDGLPQRVGVKVAPVMSDYAEEFWTDYARHWKLSTQKRNREALKRHILPDFGPMRIDLVGRAEITRWRDSFADGRGMRFNRAIPVLAAMFKYAEQLGYIRKGSNPCRGMPRYKANMKERFLSSVEIRRLAAELVADEAAYPNQVAIIRLLLFTGARVSEIRDLHWEWVQLPRLMLPDSKTGPKTIFLNSQAVRIFDGIARREDNPFVFPNRKGNCPTKLDLWWSRFRRRCALPDVRIHDLRHSFASVGVRDNVALATIGSLLGHFLPETTARYAHLADDIIAEAAQRVSGGLAETLGLSS